MTTWILAAAAVVVLAWVAWMFRGQPGDDPYITYRYASNVASGQGFVFNSGERVQSTTTPLFTLLLAGAGALGMDIPATGYVLSVVSLAAFGVLAVALARSSHVAPPLALSAVILTFASQVTTYGLGTEMPLLMALAWGSWLAGASHRLVPAALLAGMAAVTRGDGVLVGVALAAVYFYTGGRLRGQVRNLVMPTVLYLLVAGCWYAFAWAYFGTPLPATLGAKLAQGSTPGTTHFLEGLGFFWARQFSNNTLYWAAGLALLVAGLPLLVRRTWLCAPLVWAVLFCVGFGLLNVPRYPWYYSPLVPVAMFLMVAGAQLLFQHLAVRLKAPLRAERVGLLAALAVMWLAGTLLLAQDYRARRPEPSTRSRLYMSVADWMRAETPAEASLGAEEVGLLGYFSGRRIIDFVGLIQPDVAPHRARGDNEWVLRRYRPDYILALPAWLGSVGAGEWVKEHYTSWRTFNGPGGELATLLKRRD